VEIRSEDGRLRIVVTNADPWRSGATASLDHALRRSVPASDGVRLRIRQFGRRPCGALCLYGDTGHQTAAAASSPSEREAEASFGP
jgi:hypothetical protein